MNQREKKIEEAGKNYTIKSFIIIFSLPHIIIMNEMSF
jgi:hypothetical protein